MLVDSHCHLDRLDLSAHDGSLDAALEAARQRGVGHFLCIGVSADNAADVKALTERYADVDCSVGVHPLDVQPGAAPALDWLLGELNHPQVVAIGETGLDYHYEPEAAELQQASFRLHLQAARQTGKPVIVHTRGARADTLALLREAALPQAGVLHCFTEDWDMAKAALDLGFYISLSGIVTFRNADALRDVARQVPADRLNWTGRNTDQYFKCRRGISPKCRDDIGANGPRTIVLLLMVLTRIPPPEPGFFLPALWPR